MEFAFSDEQKMIAETVQSFFRENATSQRTRAAMAADGIDRVLWSAFCTELGLSGVGLPEEHGGAGLGMIEFAIVAEAAGSQVAAIPLLGHAMAAQAIASGGSAEQQAAYLPGLISGELIGTMAASYGISCANSRLTGSCEFVAHGAAADLLVIASGDGGWIVRADDPGVEISPKTTMDQTRPFAIVSLNTAPCDPLPNWRTGIEAARVSGWICLAAEALGGAQEALDRTVAYARERVQFGRQIGSFQAYKHRLADMMIEIEQARSAVYWAACAVDEGSAEATIALHAAKSFCADTFFMVAGNMIQLHGGIGFTWEHDAHLFFKRARAIQSMLGGGNYHREEIARMILGEAA